jgi:hypothetical protein
MALKIADKSDEIIRENAHEPAVIPLPKLKKRKAQKQIKKRCWNHPTALSVGHLVPRCLLVLHLKNSVHQN